MLVPQKELHQDIWSVTHLENIRPLYLAYIAEESITAKTKNQCKQRYRSFTEHTQQLNIYRRLL